MKQVKENGYQESIISKIFKRFTNNPSLIQSQQHAQAKILKSKSVQIYRTLKVLAKNYGVYSDIKK